MPKLNPDLYQDTDQESDLYEDPDQNRTEKQTATKPQEDKQDRRDLRPTSTLDRMDRRLALDMEQSVQELDNLSSIIAASKRLINNKIRTVRQNLHNKFMIKEVEVPAVEKGPFRTSPYPSKEKRPSFIAKMIQKRVPLYAAGFVLGISTLPTVNAATKTIHEYRQKQTLAENPNVYTHPKSDEMIDEAYKLGTTCTPTPEICDGIDNDCDGRADNGLNCRCTPSEELCDGRDNNCDGRVDEGYNVGAACSVGVGACARTGIILCDGKGSAKCSATPGKTQGEICGNGVDDDCNGQIDEAEYCR